MGVEKHAKMTFSSTPGSSPIRTLAYIRISTGGQGLESQRLAIVDDAHRHGLTVHACVEAPASARHAGVRRGVDALLEQVHPGDLLLVSELSHLGRRVGQVIPLVDRLLKQRVPLVAIKEHMRLTGTQALQTSLLRSWHPLRCRQRLSVHRSAPWGRPRGSRGADPVLGVGFHSPHA
jgi:hypothetical protein